MPPDTFQMLNDRLDRIEDRLEELRSYMLKNPPCPDPSTCIALGRSHSAVLERVERLELQILDFEKWRSWAMGVSAAAIFAATIFGPSIRKALNLE